MSRVLRPPPAPRTPLPSRALRPASRWRLALTLAALVGLAGGSLALPSPGQAEPAAAPAPWILGMASAARAWLEGGGAAAGGQRAFADPERGNWHYVPRRRQGVALGDMPPALRARALALLRSGLSTPGAAQAEAVMALEGVLAALEGSSPRVRDPLGYALAIFGKPGAYPWGWRLEGHHLSLQVTVVSPERVAMTPWFLGTNPARIPRGPRAGERLQAPEQDLALELARSLDPAQWRAALLDARTPGDVITGPGRAASLARPQGIAFDALTAAQQASLVRLIEAYVGRARDDFGRPYLELVKAGLSQTRLGWAGSRAPGAPFYYRVHGPRLLLELDNTQNDANHVHSLWRDPVNDFGRDDLRVHYGSAAHGDLTGR